MHTRSLCRVSRPRCLLAIIVAGYVGSVATPVASATPPECRTRWLDGVPTSDISYSGSYVPGVRSLTVWDPDGDGPEPVRLVAGGAFDTIGGIGSPQVAAWVPGDRAFTALGQGLVGPDTFGAYVTAVATAPRADGGQDLYAAGRFIASGDTAINGVARWDGANWLPLGTGLGPVPQGYAVNVRYLMTGCADGSLVIAGTFTTAGGLPATGLARWDGTSWSIPATVAGGDVSAVACLPDNSLVIAGSFTSVNGDPIARVARIQNGAATPLGGEQIGNVNSLAITPNGTVYATSDAPTMRIWKWNDGGWTQIGIATTTQYSWDLGAAKIISLSDSTIALAGYFTSLNGEAMTNNARFDGASWEEVGSPESPYAAVQLPDGRIVTARTNLQVSEELSTSPLLGQVPQLTDGTAYAVDYFEGDLIIAGIFTSIQGTPVVNVARRTADGWRQMGSLSGITDLLKFNGSLYAAGTFEGHFARWNGEQWVVDQSTAVPPRWPYVTRYQLCEHVGTLILSYYDGYSRFMKLTSTGWVSLPGFSTTRMSAVVASAAGQLYAGGGASTGNLLRRLDGSQWTPVSVNGLPATVIKALCTHEGRLYICYPTPGQTYSSRIGWTVAYGDGESFATIGRIGAPLRSFVSTPQGDLYGMSEQSAVYRIRDEVIEPIVGGLGTYDTSLDWIQIAAGARGEVAILRRRSYGGNDFAEFLDPRPVALRDVPTQALVCEDGRADVTVRVLGTLDRTLQWEWDGGGEFASVVDGFVTGLGIVGGSATDALVLDQIDAAALGTHLRLVASDTCNTATSPAIMLAPGSPETYACARCAPCVADFDNDGAVTAGDLAAFIADIESGTTCADVDQDGGVTSADIGAFFLAYESGGC